MPKDNETLCIKLRSAYSLSERVGLLKRFQDFVNAQRAQTARSLSNHRIGVVVTDVVALTEYVVSLDAGAPAKWTLASAVTPRTIANFVDRTPDPSCLSIHMDTLHVVDAFLQICEHDPPDGLHWPRL